MALLDEYIVGVDGPWSDQEAAHLHRRAAFGATPEERLAAVGNGSQDAFRAAVDALVNFSADDPLLDAPAIPGTGSYGDALASLPDDASDLGKLKTPRDLVPLMGHWLYRMRYTSQPLQEQLTLFLHDHFVSEWSKLEPKILAIVADSGCYATMPLEELGQLVKDLTVKVMLDQNYLLRERGIDSFRDLLLAATRDPAMLLYLDNYENRKGRAQENYAREMMELFSMGVGNYGEQDIREIARSLTGETMPRFDCGNDFDTDWGFSPEIHEAGTKLVFGQTIPERNDGTETELIVDLMMTKRSIVPPVGALAAPYNTLPATAIYLSWKLIHWFCNHTATLSPPDPAVLELAHYMRGTDNAAYPQRRYPYDMRAVLRKLFLSKYFHDASSRFGMYKTPADFVAGVLRALNIRDQFASNNGPGIQMVLMGMILFIPPNVSGWQHGRAWITSGSLVQRYNYGEYLTEFYPLLNPGWPQAIQGLLSANGGPITDENSFDELIDYFADRLIQTSVTAEERALLLDFMATVPVANNPVTRFRERVLGLIHLMLTLPMAHLK